MNTNISAILKEKRLELGLSIGEVLSALRANGVVVSDKTLYGWERGFRQPNAATFLLLCRIYGIDSIQEVSQDRVEPLPALSGEAMGLARDYEKLDRFGRRQVRTTAGLELERVTAQREEAAAPTAALSVLPGAPRRAGGMVELRVYDQPAAAGLGNYLDEPPRHTEQYPAERIPPQTDFGVRIDGDSMEPRLHSGGTAFVQSCVAIDSGKIGIFVLNAKAYCKRLAVDHRSRQVRLVSLNPAYPDIVIGENDELRTLGRVLGQWTPGYEQELFGW